MEEQEIKTDRKDKLFAVLYFLLGYGFIHVFWSIGALSFQVKFSIFTVLYIIIVCTYLLCKNVTIPNESYFWLFVLAIIGISYSFWSIMPLLQVMAAIFIAAYWTLSAADGFIVKGKTSQWVAFDSFNAVFVVPFYNFGCHIKVLLNNNEEKKNRNTLRQRVFSAGLGFLIAIPVLAIVLPLLSSADAGFEQVTGHIVFYIQQHFLMTILRIILSLPVTAYLFGLLYGGAHRRNTERIRPEDLKKAGSSARIIPVSAVCTAISIICATYILFIGIQGKYLFSAFAGIRPDGFTYAEYARRGFFELCQLAALNLLILLCAELFSKTGRKESKALSWINIVLSSLTLILIITAMSKMLMYIHAYGLTVKRILTMVFMLWMAVTFVLVMIRQWKTFAMVRISVMTGAVLFCLLCVIPVQHLISESQTQHITAIIDVLP